MTAGRTQSIIITATGLLALAVAWLFNAPGSPALYDGLCLPTQYWSVVNNSPGVPSPKPVTETVPITNGKVPTIQVTADNDQDPQAQILINEGSITVPPGTTAITLGIRALAPPAVKPPQGFVDSNLYEFTITTSTGAPVTLTESPTITLRTASGASNAIIERFDGKSWTALTSSQVGCTNAPIAAITELGDYAAVSPTKKPSTQAPPARKSAPVALIVAIAAAFVLLLLGGIARRRRR